LGNVKTADPGTSCLATISLALRDKNHPYRSTSQLSSASLKRTQYAHSKNLDIAQALDTWKLGDFCHVDCLYLVLQNVFHQPELVW
jgi:hypothetical protein